MGAPILGIHMLDVAILLPLSVCPLSLFSSSIDRSDSEETELISRDLNNSLRARGS